jgi:catechol 2,3-dioxygenase-like lactoylglutathione lyase family enzyme
VDTTFRSKSLVLLVLLVAKAIAQTQPSAPDVPSFVARGAFFAIVVADLDATEHWYESNLGLRRVKRGRSSRVPAETVVLAGRNLYVELIHHDGKQISRIENEKAQPRFLKAGLVVEPREFDVVATQLAKHGVSATIFEDKEMGVRSFLVKDNEGNLIQFFTPSP